MPELFVESSGDKLILQDDIATPGNNNSAASEGS